jgi:hypothetical protein
MDHIETGVAGCIQRPTRVFDDASLFNDRGKPVRSDLTLGVDHFILQVEQQKR